MILDAPPLLPLELHRPTLLEVIALIERRISNLDRLGPPNAAGYTCVGCKDAELHRLLGAVRELAKRDG